MAEILTLHKNLGETPLECLGRYKAEHPEYKDTKMTYLGRLDPMAEGLLLVLAGDTKGREEFLSLDKTYEFEVLWGFETDTYDVLGLLQREPNFLSFTLSAGVPTAKKFDSLLRKIKEKKTQEYPLFSSKMFGKDFLKARGLNIEGIEIPEKNIKIFDISHIHTRYITGREVLSEVSEKIRKVNGDFRQEQILGSWQNALITMPNEMFLISKFKADVSSGTYIRGLAHEMGNHLKCGALAWSIKRTRVGEWKI